MPTQAEPTLEEIQERVGMLERALLEGAGGRPRHRTGIRVSDWFIPTGLAWRLGFGRGAPDDFGPLLGLGRRRVAKALLTRRRHPWRLLADALTVNKNYRVFFLAERLTVKAHFPAAGGEDPIAREIRFRSEATGTPAIRLPEMLHHGTVAGASYLAERMISGASRVDPGHGAAALADALFDFYAANGLTTRPLEQAATPERWQDAAAEALPAAGIGPSGVAGARDGLARLFAEAAGRRVLWGLCHGDLSLGNMLRAGSGVYLLDWEEAHRGLIYGDLAKLSVTVPGFAAHFDARASELCGTDAALPVQKALADVALLHRLWRESSVERERPAKRRRLEAAAERVMAACAPEAGR